MIFSFNFHKVLEVNTGEFLGLLDRNHLLRHIERRRHLSEFELQLSLRQRPLKEVEHKILLSVLLSEESVE